MHVSSHLKNIYMYQWKNRTMYLYFLSCASASQISELNDRQAVHILFNFEQYPVFSLERLSYLEISQRFITTVTKIKRWLLVCKFLFFEGGTNWTWTIMSLNIALVLVVVFSIISKPVHVFIIKVTALTLTCKLWWITLASHQ